MRLLVLALAAIAAAAGAVILAFVAAVWRISRDLDVTPTATPELEDEETWGMPTWQAGPGWGSLSDSDINALNRGLREVRADQLVPWRSDNLTSVRPDLTSVRNGTYSRLD